MLEMLNCQKLNYKKYLLKTKNLWNDARSFWWFFEPYFGMYKIVGIPQLFLDCKNKFAKILHKTFNEKEI